MRNLDPSEYHIQTAFVEYVSKKHPHYRKLLIHIPNEGKRSPIEGKRQKALGLTKGVSDLFLALPLKTKNEEYFSGLWLEIKKKKGRLTPEQKLFLMCMRLYGYQAKAVYSLEEAIKVFEDYVAI